MIVVDSNIICYLYIEGEFTSKCEKLLQKDNNWIAPLLWKSEFRNVLSFYYRKEILSQNDILQIIEEAESLMKQKEFDVNSQSVIDFVTQSNLSAYDCEFIALANEFDVPLVTTDQKIIKTFPKIAYHLKDYIK